MPEPTDALVAPARRVLMVAPEDRQAVPLVRNIGVGCVTTVAGFFSGGMIAVFIGKIVGLVQRCAPEPGLPACNWWVYAGVGGVLGAVTLPVLALRRLNRGRSDE